MEPSTICRLPAACVAVTFALLVWSGTAAGADAEPVPRMLAHDVYFTLKDKSDEAKEKLVAGCKKYLADHPGTVWFAAGAVVAEHQREVNDRDFDVALHIVFKDKQSHDQYQDAPKHHKFIEAFSDYWDTVRVFDSWVEVSSHGEVAAERDRSGQAKKPRLPDPTARFAGMIQGKVVAKYDDEIVVAVEKVTRVWRTSKAEDPNALVGKEVLINAPADGRYASRVARFVRSLETGEEVTLDVAHRGRGEALTILPRTD